LLVVATKCLAMSVPPAGEEPGLGDLRVGQRLLRREGLAGDHEERLGFASSSRSTGVMSWPSTLETKCRLQAAVAEGLQRRHDHLRPEVAAADADVDDVRMPLLAVSRTARQRPASRRARSCTSSLNGPLPAARAAPCAAPRGPR
jgi:hypothetical protein